MDKLNKLGSTVQKKLQGKKSQNSNNNSGGQSLQELVKDATAKTLRRPDGDINQQVVDLIGSAIHTEGPKEVARILTERLTLKNPHKVWLAIELIKEVLRKCETDIAPVREDIMKEVGKVASGALNRYNSNLADQQRAKSAAFDLLKTYGQDGHILSQPHLEHDRKESGEGPPRTPRGTGERGSGRSFGTWMELREAVETQIAVAVSHNDLLQDMLLDTSSFESRTPEQRALAKDVILEATQFRQSFEQLLAQLSAYDTDEANNLMTTALEKMDILNTSLNLHKENLKKQLQGQQRGHTQGAVNAAFKRPSASSPTKSGALEQVEPALGGLMELQQGFDAAHQPPQMAGPDPFAASSELQQPGPQQGPPPQGPPHHGWPQPQPPHHSQQAQQHGANPFGSTSGGGWHGFQQMPPPGGYPGYGYGGYGPGYGYGQMPPPNFSQPPLSSQGYGQQQQWQGYQQHPTHGYGHYGPPYGYQPYPMPQASGPGNHQNQQRGPQPSAHVPASLIEATITLPPEKAPAAGGNGKQEGPHPQGRYERSAQAPSQPVVASPAAPSTPPATAGGPSATAASPMPPSTVSSSQAPPAGSKQDTFSATPLKADAEPSSSTNPDSASSPFLAGFSTVAPANGPQQQLTTKAAPVDDWDLFFTERAAAGGKQEGKEQPGKTGVDHLTDAFGDVATSSSTVK